MAYIFIYETDDIKNSINKYFLHYRMEKSTRDITLAIILSLELGKVEMGNWEISFTPIIS
jgi:hypothetical protein